MVIVRQRPELEGEIVYAQCNAYHEAGHAWVTYWHFVRKEWCQGVEIDIATPEDTPGLKPDDIMGPPCGVTVARGIREPDPWYWTYYAARSAAGLVAEGLFAVQEGLWSWSKWEATKRSGFEGEIADLVEWPDDESHSDDLANWFRWGRDHFLLRLRRRCIHERLGYGTRDFRALAGQL